MGRLWERAGRLFEQAPRPWGSWQKCLEQGGERSGGLDPLGPGVGALSWAASRKKKSVSGQRRFWSVTLLRKTRSPQDLSLGSRPQTRGSLPRHSEPPALLPGL